VRLPDLIELVALAAIWGASFLFMRVAAPELGPVALMALRVGIAAALLLPVLALRGGLAALRARLGHVAVVGVVNSAVPFCLLGYATLSLSAGLASILNATSPLWGALVAHLWLGERLDRARVAGLALGFGGVAFLATARSTLGAPGGVAAVAAALGATLSYGIGASYTRRFLKGVDPLAVAAGSQAAAALALVVPAWALWPAAPPPARAWGAVIALGTACTAVAYVMYFRLIAHVGPARAISVTFLIPAFAVAWGAAFLGEALSARTLGGAAVVLAGTALATGAIPLPGGARRLTTARTSEPGSAAAPPGASAPSRSAPRARPR
jgi:drug/metabolite transporter (DMT)-like permease